MKIHEQERKVCLVLAEGGFTRFNYDNIQLSKYIMKAPTFITICLFGGES